jgi:hypothetical protein
MVESEVREGKLTLGQWVPNKALPGRVKKRRIEESSER